MAHLTSLRIHNRADQHRVWGLIVFAASVPEARALGLRRLILEIGPYRREVALEQMANFDESDDRFYFAIVTQQLRNGPAALLIRDVSDTLERGAPGTEPVVARYGVIVDNPGALASVVGNIMDENRRSAILVGQIDSRMFPYEAARVNGLELEQWTMSAANGAVGLQSDRSAVVHEAMMKDGFAVLPERVPESLCDRFVAEVKAEIDSGRLAYEWGSSTRLHHTHRLPSGSQIWKFPPVIEFLKAWFQDLPVACQTLFYFNGSGQRAHQDTIHLTSFPAGFMCGVWVALEDVQPDSGELFVYRGSHGMPRLYVADLCLPKVREDYSAYSRFDDEIENLLSLGGYERTTYRPKKGEILVWHENLAHGGSPRLDLSKTRTSVVSHYFARSAAAYYDSRGEAATLEELG